MGRWVGSEDWKEAEVRLLDLLDRAQRAEQLEALVTRQRAMLERVQWGEDDFCRICDHRMPDHMDNCDLAALLAEGRTETGATS